MTPVRLSLFKSDNDELRSGALLPGDPKEFWAGLVTGGKDFQVVVTFEGVGVLATSDLLDFGDGTYALLFKDGGGSECDTGKYFFLRELNGALVPSAYLFPECRFQILSDGAAVKSGGSIVDQRVQIVFRRSEKYLALEAKKLEYVDAISGVENDADGKPLPLRPYELPDQVFLAPQNARAYSIWRFSPV